MATQSNAPKQFVDFLGPFPDGMNSGVEPLLLPKTQLASAINATVRGAYLTNRPPIIKKTLVFDSPLTQQTFEQGLFQGAGYYRPDYGTESLIASISGHLFQCTETGSAWIVTDISIPGDPLSATATQVWMWQAEKWLIVNDGTDALPVFFDGVSSRRSAGASVLLGTATTFTPASPPALGSVVTATLTANYTGPFDVPVLLNGEYYKPTASGVPTSTFQVTLKNLHVTTIGTVSAGASIVAQPGTYGYLDFFTTIGTVLVSGYPNYWYSFVAISGNPDIPVGTTISIATIDANNNSSPTQWKVLSKGSQAGHTIYYIGTIGYTSTTVGPGIKPDQLVYKPGNTSPNVPIATVETDFAVPVNIGDSVIVTVGSAYTGAAGASVWIGSDQYSITAVSSAPGAPSSSLMLINITDVKTAAYVNGTTITSLPILSVPELPAGRMGVYGMGRVWECLTDGISFLGGDVVGGPAGTPANDYRDAVLKTSENTFLAGGGSFRLPGTGNIISSMQFVAILDASLGQGPLQVGTQDSVFSVNTPVDRSTWESLTNPILTESLIGPGPLAQDSTVLANSDMMFRSVEGLGSLVIARRDFGEWGNTPISEEMKRILDADNKSLLPYGSGITFDDRLLMTTAPYQTAQGVIHLGLVVMNFDALGNLRGRTPPGYDGAWTGLNTLKLLTGSVNGYRRAFAFGLNLIENRIELYEFLPTGSAYFDNGSVPIKTIFETPVAFNADIKLMTTLIRLQDGEIYLRNIVGTVNVEVYYRPDFYPCWTIWNKLSVCADTTVQNGQPGYRCRLGLGEPDGAPCEAGNDRPMRVGNFFQFRVVITGHCEWMGMKVGAVTEMQPFYAKVAGCATDALAAAGPAPGALCQSIVCTVPDDLLQYSLQGLPPQPVPAPITIVPGEVGNGPVYFDVPCDGVLVYKGTLPSWIILDAANNRLIGQSGVFPGDTQADADAAAQSALNNFGNIQIAAGLLVCHGAPPPPVYGNATVYYNVTCTTGTLTFTGVLPAWITLDDVNSRLIGASGIFSGASAAAATADAQTALNEFGDAQMALGALTCFVAPACDGSDIHQYQITGYYDGLLANAIGPAPIGGETTWDGTFPYKDLNNSCRWFTNYDLVLLDSSGLPVLDSSGLPILDLSSRLIMGGKQLCLVTVEFNAGNWVLTFYADNQLLWQGTKDNGITPAGQYTRNAGVDAAPVTISLAPIYYTPTVWPNASIEIPPTNCSP